MAANSMPFVVIESVPGGEVMLPEGFNIATADYGYAGADLMLTAEDGAMVVIRGFLSGGNPPALATPQGAHLNGEAAVRLAGVHAGAVASSPEPVGHVITAGGAVFVIRADGSREELAAGSPLFPGDILESGIDGALGIVLADETTFAMAAGGRMIIEEATYDSETQTGSVSLTVLYGSYTFTGGLAAKNNPDAMTIHTLTADIGIHDAQAGINIPDGMKLTVAIMENAQGLIGEVVISNSAGILVLDIFNQYVIVGGFHSLPADIPNFSLGFLYDLFADSLRYLPLTYNDGNDYGAQRIAAAVDENAAPTFVTDAGGEAADESPAFIKVVGEDYTRAGADNDPFATESADAPAPESYGTDRQFASEMPDRQDSAPREAQEEVSRVSETIVPDDAAPDNAEDDAGDGSHDDGDHDDGKVLAGGKGDDSLYGGGGDDKIDGGKGDDALYGNAGDDKLEGGKGDDTLYGGAGDDILKGGKGSDTFVFKAGDGGDVVTDFKIGDVLRFEGEEFSLDGVSFTQDGEDTIITFGGDADVEVTVSGVDADSLKGYSTTEIDADAVIIRMDDLD